jgi:hypothetical protein
MPKLSSDNLPKDRKAPRHGPGPRDCRVGAPNGPAAELVRREKAAGEEGQSLFVTPSNDD